MIKIGDIVTFKKDLSYRGHSIARKNEEWNVVEQGDDYCQVQSRDARSVVGFSYKEEKELYIWDYIKETKEHRAKRIIDKFKNK